MREILQHIIFPDDYSLEDCKKLFYRGDNGRLTGLGKEATLRLNACQWVEFCTYMNGFSYAKWKKYTPLEELTLTLEYSGEAEITLVGYSMIQKAAARKVLSRQLLKSSERKIAELTIPENAETLIGFEISVISGFEIFGGAYLGSFPDSSVRNIELALLTTTFKREGYIRKNMLRMKEGLFDIYPEIAAHIRMHITDNGRTLTKEDLPNDPHFLLHPNPNAGGAGGYARGMMECMHQEPAATHGILMDDDIMILPDSIYRTYELLRFIREEYREHFVGGAMLMLEDKVRQYEDMGSVTSDGSFMPVKTPLNHAKLLNNLKNEQEDSLPNTYQAWWYCCIPVSVMKKYGLPLPLFIRGDDVEYSLRCKAKIITMNGICLWHMGFAGKFSASLNVYQEIRNLMFDQSASGILPGINYMARIKHIYRTSILKRDYVTCEMLLKAWEDYMKGPEFFMEDRGEQIIRENGAAGDKMVPFSEIPVPDFDWRKDPLEEKPRETVSTFLYRLTWNGHVRCLKRWIKNETVILSHDLTYRPGKMAMKRTYVAVDAANQKACVWEMDKARFKTLQKRYKKDHNFYEKHKDEIREAYRKQGDYLKSEEFWRKYLKLD